MISDVPHVTYTEGRFLPYFFPDTFNETGNPVEEANQNWIQARRAILRSPIQRMGFGGYLVADGGGFIGVGEPTAIEHQGEFFQLADILGVQKEVGFSLSLDKYNILHEESHFITKESSSPINFGESMKHVYQADRKTTVLAMEEGDVTLAANEFEQGRSVYMAGLPYSSENTRLLLRAIYWAASREKNVNVWQTTNIQTECAAYPEVGKYVVINNSYEVQKTGVYKEDGSKIDVTIAAMGYKWFEI